jgi:hypothetical protein
LNVFWKKKILDEKIFNIKKIRKEVIIINKNQCSSNSWKLL